MKKMVLRHFYQDGDRIWLGESIIKKSKNLKPFIYHIPEDILDKKIYWIIENIYDFIGHFRRCINANLEDPIVLSVDNKIMNGNHRIIKAIYEGRKTIKAVKFDVMPKPDMIGDHHFKYTRILG